MGRFWIKRAVWSESIRPCYVMRESQGLGFAIRADYVLRRADWNYSSEVDVDRIVGPTQTVAPDLKLREKLRWLTRQFAFRGTT